MKHEHKWRSIMVICYPINGLYFSQAISQWCDCGSQREVDKNGFVFKEILNKEE